MILKSLKPFYLSFTNNSSTLFSATKLAGLSGVVCCREKSTKPGRLKPHRGHYRYRGIKTPDSTFVTSGTSLVSQRGLVYFPGLNVGVGRDFTLFALEHGRVFVTTEKVCPNWSHSFIKRFYGQFKDSQVPIYKNYLHVIPIPMPNKFKLVEQY
ncbi:39S ribosomal protein L27, mitochondrial [Hyalella azteca]|uniref:39S ribosomal protein L27, mitochondrial n=1 Tax=Hyalella azteca TaxID=294128 RepID=A0A8B7P1W7_HYAAZ|nr:39S ribosomal protein L27, mitochondrial [Hyalella azteca]